MARSILIGCAVGLPLAVGLAVLANSADLSRGVILALYAIAVAVPVLVGAHLEDSRRHPPRPRAGHH